jgi:hypothetical protein
MSRFEALRIHLPHLAKDATEFTRPKWAFPSLTPQREVSKRSPKRVR